MAAMMKVVQSAADKQIKLAEFILDTENPDSVIVQLASETNEAIELMQNPAAMDVPPQPWEKELYGELLAFILDRLKVYLKDKGKRHDIIDAAFANGGDDLVDIVNRTNALQSFLETKDGENLLAGYKRAANILKAEAKKGELPSGDIGTLSQTEAKDLLAALTKARADIDAALSKEAYSKAMTALSKLRAPIDAFFDNVMVVAEEMTERQNNLRLLVLIRDTAAQIADFDVVKAS